MFLLTSRSDHGFISSHGAAIERAKHPRLPQNPHSMRTERSNRLIALIAPKPHLSLLGLATRTPQPYISICCPARRHRETRQEGPSSTVFKGESPGVGRVQGVVLQPRVHARGALRFQGQTVVRSEGYQALPTHPCKTWTLPHLLS